MERLGLPSNKDAPVMLNRQIGKMEVKRLRAVIVAVSVLAGVFTSVGANASGAAAAQVGAGAGLKDSSVRTCSGALSHRAPVAAGAGSTATVQVRTGTVQVRTGAGIKRFIIRTCTVPLSHRAPAGSVNRAAMAASAGTYSYSEEDLCLEYSGCSIGVYFDVYATYTSSQIWINGHVKCGTFGSNAVYVGITWCGNTNNGINYLNIGVNWNYEGEWSGYARMNIFADDGTCNSWQGVSGGYPFLINNVTCKDRA
jgi:hypothetical protein